MTVHMSVRAFAIVSVCVVRLNSGIMDSLNLMPVGLALGCVRHHLPKPQGTFLGATTGVTSRLAYWSYIAQLKVVMFWACLARTATRPAGSPAVMPPLSTWPYPCPRQQAWWSCQAVCRFRFGRVLSPEQAPCKPRDVAQDRARQWRMRRLWRAWARAAAGQQRACLLADKAALVARLQQWHQRLLDAGRQVCLCTCNGSAGPFLKQFCSTDPSLMLHVLASSMSICHASSMHAESPYIDEPHIGVQLNEAGQAQAALALELKAAEEGAAARVAELEQHCGRQLRAAEQIRMQQQQEAEKHSKAQLQAAEQQFTDRLQAVELDMLDKMQAVEHELQELSSAAQVQSSMTGGLWSTFSSLWTSLLAVLRYCVMLSACSFCSSGARHAVCWDNASMMRDGCDPECPSLL